MVWAVTNKYASVSWSSKVRTHLPSSSIRILNDVVITNIAAISLLPSSQIEVDCDQLQYIHPLAEKFVNYDSWQLWFSLGHTTPRSPPGLIVIMDIQLHECMNSSIGVSDSTKLDNCTSTNKLSYLVPLFYFQMLEGKQKSHLKLHDQNGRPGQLQFFRPMDNYQKV